jgi:hypothetical protein
MPTFVFCGVLASTKIYSKHLWIMLYLGIPYHPRTHTRDNSRMSTHMVTVNKRRDQHTLSWGSRVLETRVHLWCHQDLLMGCLLIIATSSMILVSWLACKLKQRNYDAALFCGNNLTKYINLNTSKNDMVMMKWNIIKIRPNQRRQTRTMEWISVEFISREFFYNISTNFNLIQSQTTYSSCE